ncbi:MAG: hypothetical protein IKF36_03495 [Bacilli bacterium]|nr:hypothetical protein [Bacilli bacterium]
MKGIIINNNRALVIDVTDVKYDEENPNVVKITTSGATVFSGINNTVLVRSSSEIATMFAQSLVGSDGEVTTYNSNERTCRTSVVPKVADRNSKARELSLKNKTNH